VTSFPSGLGTESAGVVEAVAKASAILPSAISSPRSASRFARHAEARIAPAAASSKLPAGIDERHRREMNGPRHDSALSAPRHLPGEARRHHRDLTPAAAVSGMIVSHGPNISAHLIGTVGSGDKVKLPSAPRLHHVLCATTICAEVPPRDHRAQGRAVVL